MAWIGSDGIGPQCSSRCSPTYAVEENMIEMAQDVLLVAIMNISSGTNVSHFASRSADLVDVSAAAISCVYVDSSYNGCSEVGCGRGGECSTSSCDVDECHLVSVMCLPRTKICSETWQ